MKTVKQMETEAFLSMAEGMKALELQLDLAKKRIEELEKELQKKAEQK